MKYLDPKFSSRPASREYRENYDAVFKPHPKQREFMEQPTPEFTWTRGSMVGPLPLKSRAAEAEMNKLAALIAGPPAKRWRDSPLNLIGKPKKPRRRG